MYYNAIWNRMDLRIIDNQLVVVFGPRFRTL